MMVRNATHLKSRKKFGYSYLNLYLCNQISSNSNHEI